MHIPANGYAFVYLSNNSNINVWFDNFWVTHKRGRILQENHYYPYGLQIASISSKAAGKMDNMYRYQGAYSEFEEETGWNDFELRTYDAQVGRWTGVDPKNQLSSGYLGMGNNPISNIDKDGGWSFGLTGAVVGALAGGTVAYFIIKNNLNMDGAFKGLIGVGLPLLGAGVGYGIFESLNNRNPANLGTEGVNWTNTNTNFFANFKAFYSGLMGSTRESFTNSSKNFANSGFATPPNIWDGLKRLNFTRFYLIGILWIKK